MAKKKSTNKRAAAKASATTNEFIQIPDRLVTKLNKDITNLQKSDNKLKAAISKANAQVKKADAKVKSLARATAAKSQINAAKKSLSSAVAALASLNKQHQAITTELNSLLEQKAKLSALEKCLATFEKQWTKNVKAKKTKAKAKTQKRKKAVKPVAKLDIIDNSPADQADANDIESNEPTEIAA